MAIMEGFGISEFFIRMREMTRVGQSEVIELLDINGNNFMNVELGVLGRDEEVTDSDGKTVGRMQDKMHIENVQGYRYRNLLDSQGNLLGIAMPQVPDPSPGERHYFLKDGNDQVLAMAVTTQQNYPEWILVDSPDRAKTFVKMQTGTDSSIKGKELGRTSYYRLAVEDSSLPKLLMFEFLVSIFLFVLKA